MRIFISLLFSTHSDFACYDYYKRKDIFNGLISEQYVRINSEMVVKNKINLCCFINIDD